MQVNQRRSRGARPAPPIRFVGATPWGKWCPRKFPDWTCRTRAPDRVHGTVPVDTSVFIEGKDGPISGYSTVRYCSGAMRLHYRPGVYRRDQANRRPEALDGEIDYYEFLQISPKAEIPTIQRIYKFLASRFHPTIRSRLILKNSCY